MSAQGKLVLIIGPSGVGKSVIINALREAHPEFVFPPSVTTREPRPGERDGEIYHFVSDAEFDSMIQKGELLEWAIVHQGPRYGTLKKEILGSIGKGKTVIREVDVQGFKSIRALPIFDPRTGQYRLQSIFLLPGSDEELEKRIRSRAPIEESELQKRLLDIRMECAYSRSADHEIRNPDGKLEETMRKVKEAILAP